MIDSNVFIDFEKGGKSIDFSAWARDERAYISVIIASELLMGVHRANSLARRERRLAFVEAVLAGVGILEVNLSVARVHAEIYAELADERQLIGSHDLLIAATARFHRMALLTGNVQEFSRVPGL
jgi:predicted nucleic acid-binding protein